MRDRRLGFAFTTPPRVARCGATRAARSRGLTVVELLVVLGCLLLLTGLVVPSLSRAGAAARSLRCQANLRQLANATFAYANIYGGHAPAAVLYFSTPAGIETAAWDFIHHPGGEVSGGPLWSFIDAGAPVLQCPDFEGSSTFGNDPYTGYNYNTSFIGAEGGFPQVAADGRLQDGWAVARFGLPPAAQRRVSETALFGDGGWKSGANKFMRAPMNTVEENISTVYGGGQAFRHLGCTNVVYLDGHCGCPTVPYEGELATEDLLRTIMGHPRNGFLSNDDRSYDPR